MLRISILIISIVAALSLASCAGEEPLPYLSLGDSLAVGVGASDPASLGYAPLYEKYLEEKTGREVDLVQLGVSGETSESFIGSYPDEGSSQLARAADSLEKDPDAVVTLSLGANDLLATESMTTPEREAALAKYGDNLDFILRELARKSGTHSDISILAVYNPVPGAFADEWTARLNDEARHAAQDHGARFVDGSAAFRGREDEYTHRPEDFHPTDAGYRALARAFEASDLAEHHFDRRSFLSYNPLAERQTPRGEPRTSEWRNW